jgi:hypothetical protein
MYKIVAEGTPQAPDTSPADAEVNYREGTDFMSLDEVKSELLTFLRTNSVRHDDSGRGRT